MFLRKIVLVFLLCAPFQAQACSCGPNLGDTVLVFKVISDGRLIKVEIERQIQNRYRYQIQILEVIGAKIQTDYVLSSRPGDGSCGVSFEKNKIYSFRVKADYFRKIHQLSTCQLTGGSGLIDIGGIN